MFIKNKIIFSLGAIAFFVFSFLSTSVLADGKQLFLDNKCNKCHEGAGIKLLPKEPKADDDEDEDEEEEGEKKIDPVKLDGIGKQLIKDWGSVEDVKTKVPSFLFKEIKNSEDRKHKKKFNGTKDEVMEIILWLLKL